MRGLLSVVQTIESLEKLQDNLSESMEVKAVPPDTE